MKLQVWRKEQGYSQQELAAALEKYAFETEPEKAKKLPQRTVGSWEKGTLPRKGWLGVIKAFTKGKVTAADFV